MLWGGGGHPFGASGPGGWGGLSISHSISTSVHSTALYGRSQDPCSARAMMVCVRLQGCCLRVGVLPTGHLHVALF